MPPRECASENEAHSRGGNRFLAEARRRHGLLARPLAALAFPMRGRGQRVTQNRMHNPMHAPSGLARVGGCQHRVRTRACKGEMHHGTSRQAAVHAALRAFGRRGGRHRDFEGHHPRRSGRKRARRSPLGNFIELARKGFYDDLNFYNRQEGDVVVGGCPITRPLRPQEVRMAVREQLRGVHPGIGDAGYFIRDEWEERSRQPLRGGGHAVPHPQGEAQQRQLPVLLLSGRPSGIR